MVNTILEKIKNKIKKELNLEVQPKPTAIITPVIPEMAPIITVIDDENDEEDFLAAIDDEIARREEGEEEKIVMPVQEFDAQKKIATILERDFGKATRFVTLNPVRNILETSMGGSAPDISDYLEGYPDIDSSEVPAIISTAASAKRLSLTVPKDRVRNANEFFMNTGKAFGSKLERILTLKLDAPEVKKERAIEINQTIEEDYQKPFFGDFKATSLIAAKVIQDSLGETIVRLPYIQTPEELAMLTSIGVSCKLLGEMAAPLMEAVKNPNSKLEDVFQTALVLAAQKHGQLKNVSVDEALSKYKQLIGSRTVYATHLTNEINALIETRMDFPNLARGIRTELIKKNIYIESEEVSDEDEYINFKNDLAEMNLSFFRRIEEKIVPIKETKAFKREQIKLQQAEAKMEKIRTGKLEDFATDPQFAEKYEDMARLIVENIGIRTEDIPENLRTPSQRNYSIYKKLLLNAIINKVVEKRNANMFRRIGDFGVGDRVRVVGIKERIRANNYYDYLEGGSTNHVPLGAEGEFVDVSQRDSIGVRFKGHYNGEVFWLKPEELEIAKALPIRNESESKKPTEEELEKLNVRVKEVEEYIWRNVKRAAEEEIGDSKDTIKNMEQQNTQRRFRDDTKVIVARALGKEDGYYRDGKTKVANHPLERMGEVYTVDGMQIKVDIPEEDGYIILHADELDRLEEIENTTPLKKKVAAAIEKADKEYTAFNSLRTELVSEGTDNLRAMGFSDGVIGFFLNQYIESDKLPEALRTDPFNEIKKIEKGINHKEFKKEIEAAIFGKMHIVPTLEDKVNFRDLTTAIAEGVLNGYRVGEPLRERERLEEGCLLIRIDDAIGGLTKGLIGKYNDTCDKEEDGIHVVYLEGRGNRVCTLKREHARATKAYDVPKDENKRKELLAEIIPAIQKAVLTIQERYEAQTRDLAEKSDTLAGDFVDLGMSQDTIRKAFGKNVGLDTYYLRGK